MTECSIVPPTAAICPARQAEAKAWQREASAVIGSERCSNSDTADGLVLHAQKQVVLGVGFLLGYSFGSFGNLEPQIHLGSSIFCASIDGCQHRVSCVIREDRPKSLA